MGKIETFRQPAHHQSQNVDVSNLTRLIDSESAKAHLVSFKSKSRLNNNICTFQTQTQSRLMVPQTTVKAEHKRPINNGTQTVVVKLTLAQTKVKQLKNCEGKTLHKPP